MNRREVLRSLATVGKRFEVAAEDPMILTAGIEEYTTPLTRSDVLHLLRRIGFSGTNAQVDGFVGKQASEVVDVLLGTDDHPQPPSPGSWVDATTEDPNGADLQTRFAIENGWVSNMKKLSEWWLALMAADTTGVEKLTLFWDGHWTTEFSFDGSNSIPQTLYRKIATLRKDRLASFRTMALDMSLDNAMLYYLGGYLNDAGKPNENYARELMELFTTGIGWYTEGDVQQAARVLTGWKVSRYNDAPAKNGFYNAYFDAQKHDTGAKQFMGQTIPARTPDNNTEFQVKNEEVLQLIKIIFDYRAEAVSKFIAKKFYLFYVYSSPGDTDIVMVDELAKIFRDNDFTLRPMVKAMFCSQHFFDPALRGVQIKTPIECIVGLARQLGVSVPDGQNWISKMDQPMSDPPTVAGFPGYRSWISTNTYPVRRQLAAKMITDLTDTQVQTLIKSFADYTDARKLVANSLEYFLPVEVDQQRFDNYLKTLLQNAPDYEWPEIVTNVGASSTRYKAFLQALVKAPDFQLC